MKSLAKLLAGAGDVETAAAEVRAARERLTATVAEIQARAAPSHLVDETLATVRTRSAEFVETASRAARARPLLSGGILAGIALLVLRRPLWRLGYGLWRRRKETTRADSSFHP